MIEMAKELVREKYGTLSFVYESLFMGNEKQLIIYRTCTALDHYLERYRLPKNFKEKIDPMNKISEKIYETQRISNLAISTHGSMELIENIQNDLK